MRGLAAIAVWTAAGVANAETPIVTGLRQPIAALSFSGSVYVLSADGVVRVEQGQAMPVGPDWFAESLLNARPYRMRALITMGNPLLASLK